MVFIDFIDEASRESATCVFAGIGMLLWSLEILRSYLMSRMNEGVG